MRHSIYILLAIIIISVAASLSLLFMGERILEVKLTIHAPFYRSGLTIDGTQTNRGFATVYFDETYQELQYHTQDSASISVRKFNELAPLVTDNGFWSFRERYPSLTDDPGYNITVKTNLKTYSVYCRGECPEGILEIIEAIRDLWVRDIIIPI